jgi:hypothetical protein
MTQDESVMVEDLLLAWHRWQDSYQPALGLPRCDPTCRDCEIPTTFMTAQEKSEAVDAKIWKRNSEQVEACVEGLSWQQRAAIQTEMRNKRSGFDVFKNPRFAPAEVHYLYQSAKEDLYPKFVVRGLIKVMEAV